MQYRNSILFKSVVILTLFSISFLFIGADLLWAQELALVVPSGTPVTIKIDQDVNSKEFPVGSKIQASVANDVIIDGKVVIRAGSPCDVTVVSAKKAGIVGAPGAITVSVNYVKAVDGTNIPISSATKSEEGKSQVTTAIVITILCCILGLLIKGKEGVIPAGTQLIGYTVSQAEVNV